MFVTENRFDEKQPPDRLCLAGVLDAEPVRRRTGIRRQSRSVGLALLAWGAAKRIRRTERNAADELVRSAERSLGAARRRSRARIGDRPGPASVLADRRRSD